MTETPTTLAGVSRASSGGAMRAEARWAGVASVVYVVAAIVLVLVLRMPSPEAIARTAHLGTLLSGYDPTALAFGTERPPLLTLLALPFAILSAARIEGFAVALATSLFGGFGLRRSMPR